MQELGDDVLGVVAHHVDRGEGLASVGATCTQWRRVALRDELWEDKCARVFRLTERAVVARDHRNNSWRVLATPTFRRAYQAWAELCRAQSWERVDGDALLRVGRAWEVIVHHHAPSVIGTLRPGMPHTRWMAWCEDSALDPFAPHLRFVRALYSLHNGHTCARLVDCFFGGFVAYDFAEAMHFVSPLALGADQRPTIVVAMTPHANRAIVVDATTGQTFAQPFSTPATPVPAHRVDESLCVWLEEFARRLRDGVFRLAPMVPDVGAESQGLVLFPRAGPGLSRAVTRGVECCASTARLGHTEPVWAYSVRLRLVPEGEEGGLSRLARGFDRAQLASRHWTITAGDGSRSEVRGPGVVGKFPVLEDGGFSENGTRQAGDFVYQSLTGVMQPGNPSYFEGSFRFVAHPSQEEFDVVVPRFAVAQGDFFF